MCLYFYRGSKRYHQNEEVVQRRHRKENEAPHKKIKVKVNDNQVDIFDHMPTDLVWMGMWLTEADKDHFSVLQELLKCSFHIFLFCNHGYFTGLWPQNIECDASKVLVYDSVLTA